MKQILIRDAVLEDAPRLAEIYDYYVRNTAITFECHSPSAEEFRGRMAHTMEKYPYLVILSGSRVAGYAYAGPLNVREAYDWACEMTIYLDPEARHAGLGGRLYGALEDALRRMGILNLYACIGYPEQEDAHLTRNSAQFHEHLGYSLCGRFRRCGYKFGTWYDMIWMEKIIGEHQAAERAIVPYPELLRYDKNFSKRTFAK